MQNFKNADIPKISVICGFAILYSVISLIDHYTFRTYAWDLGIYNQALYDYAHFRFNFNTVLQPGCGNLLSDHFELLLMLASPLYYLFGSYTLLIVQIAAILFGGEGVYRYVELISNKKKLALAAMIQFFLFYGIYSAITFDYHNNVVGAMFVPWIFYFIQKEKWGKTIFLFILFLISKENMSLWSFFIFIGLMIMYRKDRKKLIFSSVFCIVSLIYFVVIVDWVIPSIAIPGNDYLHFQYDALGNNISEALSTIITKPFYTFKLLFVNHIGIPEGDFVKAELHLSILLSGSVLLFFRPYYLIMLLPIYGQKLFCDDYKYWGLSSHYSIEFIPVITIGAFSIINNINSERNRKIITYILILLTICVTARTFDNTYSFFNRENQRFYSKKHYIRNFNINKAYNALNLIPENASVSAQNEFVSHLSFREKIYVFPYIGEAEYIFLLQEHSSFYPLQREQYYIILHEYLKSNLWFILLDDYPFLILKKKDVNCVDSNIPVKSEKVITYFCNADSAAPGKAFFYSDNKNQLFYNANTQSDEKAFSGKYSVKLNVDNPYGLTTTISNVKKRSFFEISAWVFSGNNDCNIVASGNTSDSFYLSGNTSTGKKKNGWKQIKINFLTPLDLPDGILKIYLWNGGEKSVYFDDLEIIYKSIK